MKTSGNILAKANVHPLAALLSPTSVSTILGCHHAVGQPESGVLASALARNLYLRSKQ